MEILLPATYRGPHIRHRTSYHIEPTPHSVGAGLELHGLRNDGTEFPVEVGLRPLETKEGVLA